MPAFLGLTTLLLLHSVIAQVPIPKSPDGFIFDESSNGIVVLEGFFDLMCPDCKAAWPVVKQVVEHYGPHKLQFRFHVFPLPYHHNSYYANQGAHVVAAKGNASDAYKWMEAVFAVQEEFGNSVTANVTPSQVISKFGSLAEKSVGVPAADFIASIGGTVSDSATRVSWKYGCSRYVSGTPTFMLNGVQVAADPSWTLAQWMQLLDPFVGTSGATETSPMTCPTSEETCEYLAGKIECCLSGESCIPNVGCRCADPSAKCAKIVV